MAGHPHPINIGLLAAQRQADFLAEADRDRLVRLAKSSAERRQSRADFTAVVMVVIALALLLAVHSLVAGPQSLQEAPSALPGETRGVSQAVSDRFSDPSAAQTVSAAKV